MSPVYVLSTKARVSLATPAASSNGCSSHELTSNCACTRCDMLNLQICDSLIYRVPRLRRMGNLSQARLANLLGAAALGVSDAMGESVRAATRLDDAASTALIAMLDFTPAGTVTTLSRVVGLTHSGAVRLVDRLVLAGYVVRRTGEDARSRAIALTPIGRRVARRARAARRMALEQAIVALTDSERETLTELSSRLVRRLTALRLEQRAQGHAPAGGALCRLCDFVACGRPDGACPATRVVMTSAGREPPP